MSTTGSNKIIACGAAFVLTLLSGLSAHATDYTLDRAVGAGSVSGVLMTDGNLGVLLVGDITNWDIVINDGVSTFELLGPLSAGTNSAILYWGGLTATSTDLLFDFSQVGGGLLIQNPYTGSSENWFALDNPSGAIGGHPSSENLRVGYGTELATLPIDGVASVGTASGVQGVPDAASTSCMLLSAVLALVAFRRRFGK